MAVIPIRYEQQASLAHSIYAMFPWYLHHVNIYAKASLTLVYCDHDWHLKRKDVKQRGSVDHCWWRLLLRQNEPIASLSMELAAEKRASLPAQFPCSALTCRLSPY